MLLVFVFAFLLKKYGTQAVPLVTPAPLGAYILPRDDPSAGDGCRRRLLDIVWSCLATTITCTWISVNPPNERENFWLTLKRRTHIIFLSIFASEFMVVWAFKQWRGAVMIREAVNVSIRSLHMEPSKCQSE